MQTMTSAETRLFQARFLVLRTTRRHLRISLSSKIRQRPSGRRCRLQRTNVSYKCGVCVEEQAWKPVVTI